MAALHADLLFCFCRGIIPLLFKTLGCLLDGHPDHTVNVDQNAIEALRSIQREAGVALAISKFSDLFLPLTLC